MIEYGIMDGDSLQGVAAQVGAVTQRLKGAALLFHQGEVGQQPGLAVLDEVVRFMDLLSFDLQRAAENWPRTEVAPGLHDQVVQLCKRCEEQPPERYHGYTARQFERAIVNTAVLKAANDPELDIEEVMSQHAEIVDMYGSSATKAEAARGETD